MSWFLIIVLSYLILAVVVLVDKYLLTSSAVDPKVYAFYVGLLSALILVIIPFIDFYIPKTSQLILALLAGAVYTYALFWFYKSLNVFEASRIVPAISGLIPLFTYGLVYFISSGRETLSFSEIMAFILLIMGSILITHEKGKSITKKSIQFSVITAFLLSSSFVLMKYVYLGQSFWNGLVWMKIGGFLMAVAFFFLYKDIREEIFRKKENLQKKTMGIFILNQGAGGVAGILQNLAVALAPLSYIAVINALQGIQYVFLLIFTVLISIKFPQFLKEEISKEIILQKIIAILLVGGGLVMLAL